MARRISLREFQQDLVRRLTEARISTETPTARLGVQIGGEHWLVRLDEAAEVMPPPVIAPVPLTQPWFRGLTNIRGNLYSVVDLSHFQGGPETPASPDCRLLLVGERYHMAAALLVGRMLGLRNLSAFERRETAPHRPWEHAYYVDKDGREWRELAMEALVYSGEFLQAGV
jgi:twitching motility protein PilI